MLKTYITAEALAKGTYVVIEKGYVRAGRADDVDKIKEEQEIESSEWIIWSIEHNAWWAPDHKGYTTLRERAGRYSYAEALDIVNGANRGNGNKPNEAMIRVAPFF